jgi:hypothetical protein
MALFFATLLATVSAGDALVFAGAATAAQPKPDTSRTIWLCRPGQMNDPCTASLKTTVVSANGTHHVADLHPATNPPIDCFYVYPNITHQTTANANLQVDPQETAIAELEASPFSQDCRVFAPMYQESTGRASGTSAEDKSTRIAYDSVLNAWNDYLAHYNDGRGVVLIGHSEGSYMLSQLLDEQIAPVPKERKLLVSAIITGLDLPVYTKGSGPLPVGPCMSAAQTGCVVDFNAFSQAPPSDSKFGKFAESQLNGLPVQDVCTNPGSLAGGSGPLVSMYRTHLPTQLVAGSTTQGIFGAHQPVSSTPWIEYDAAYVAQCVTSHGYRVLMVKRVGDAPRLLASPTAAWGLHVDDPNLAMGDLVQLVKSEIASYTTTTRR